jgi:hypothetical protein
LTDDIAELPEWTGGLVRELFPEVHDKKGDKWLLKECQALMTLTRGNHSHDAELIQEVCRWARQDDFYGKGNAFIGIQGLTKTMPNGRTKFENMLEKWLGQGNVPPKERRERQRIAAERAERERVIREERERELAEEREEAAKQAEIERKNREAEDAKARAEEEERLKQFYPIVDEFGQVWSDAGRPLEQDGWRDQVLGWLRHGYVTKEDLLKQAKKVLKDAPVPNGDKHPVTSVQDEIWRQFINALLMNDEEPCGCGIESQKLEEVSL